MPERSTREREISYYKRRLDEMAGESLRLDYEISGLRKEIKQKRQAFTLLSRLQHRIASEEEIERIFDLVLEEVNSTLGVDGTVVLTPTAERDRCRPTQWRGFSEEGRLEEFDRRMTELEFPWPTEFIGAGSFVLSNHEVKRTSFIQLIRETLGLPFFVCVPVTVEGVIIALLLCGRVQEAGSVYPPLDRADVETLQAIAGLIARMVEIRRISALQEMDRLKSRFFANVSHEFRTPITLTVGPLRAILTGHFGEIPGPVRTQLEMIERNQQRLLRLVQALLDVTRLEEGHMPLRAAPLTNFNGFVDERLTPFRSAAEQRGIVLSTDFDPALHSRTDVYVDREKIDALIANLLSNALKFTVSGRVEVSTAVHEGRLRLEVSDTGIGIRAEDLPRVFDRFHQAEGSPSSDAAGTGLGLAWVKEIAELHGGSVTVRSQPGTGSTFTVELPLGRAHLEPSSVVEFDEEDLPSLGDASRVYIVTGDGADQVAAMEELNQRTLAAPVPGRPTVLYVEDNADLRYYVRELLVDEYNVLLARDGRDGWDKIRQHAPDLVIIDHMMPRWSGAELLAEIRQHPRHRATPVIFLTARAGSEARTEGLEAGADDYVTKPFDAAELRARVRNQLRLHQQERELRETNAMLEARLEEQMAAFLRKGDVQRVTRQGVAASLVSRSRPMQEVLDMVERIGGSLSTVLISGETGTGKEVIAQAIHARSPVGDGPFVAAHCAALPPGLLESELFGHERGAFTGATSRRKGRFELAHGGTLFLDEVGEIHLDAQVKLLRVLQEQRFERVGGSETVQVKVRIIAATNRDLEQRVRDGLFREDLFYRLNVIPIALPPLRRRPEDIPLFVMHFLDRYRLTLGRESLSVSTDAMASLVAYSWPGNVREIQNLMERLVVTVADDVIRPHHLPAEIQGSGAARHTTPVDGAVQQRFATLAEHERQHILAALRVSGGAIRGEEGAAELLGVPESSLRYRMKKYGIDREGRDNSAQA